MSLKTYHCRATETEYYSMFVKAESAEAALEIALETDMDNGWQQDRCGSEWAVEHDCSIGELPELVDDAPSHWDDDPDWPVADWQAEVACDDTRQSYREWVASARAADAQDIADDWDREMLGDDALILEGMDIGDK